MNTDIRSWGSPERA